MTIKQIENIIFGGKKVTRSSSYGKRTYNYGGKIITDYHLGWDLVYRENGILKSTIVYAISDGVVYKIGKDNISGNYIYIKYPSLGILVFYCHLKNVYLKKNDKVIKGTKVALTGTTGNSSGIHLHLGIKLMSSNVWVNPLDISLSSYNYAYMSSTYLKAYSKRCEYTVNFRVSAGLDSTIIKNIEKNTIVRVLNENEYSVDGFNWDKIEYDGKVGYIANEYLKDYIRITTSKVNARIKPGTSKTVVKTFNKNKKINVFKRKDKIGNGIYFDKIKI